MIEALLILHMAVAARMAGGGLNAHLLNKKGATDEDGNGLGGVAPVNLTWVPEILFALPFGVFGFAVADGALAFLLAIPAVVWSYAWIQTGHGVVLPWGKPMRLIDMQRKQTLSPVVDWLAAKLKMQTKVGYIEDKTYGYSVAYCRLFMAVKGLLIGLPVGGIPLAILWPLAYEIGERYENWSRPYPGLGSVSHAMKEFASGIGAALSIIVFSHLFLA